MSSIYSTSQNTLAYGQIHFFDYKKYRVFHYKPLSRVGGIPNEGPIMEKCDINHFDNDVVTDWLYDLRRTDDLTIVSKALTNAVETRGRLFERECTLGIAAAEIVAAMVGHPSSDIPFTFEDYIERAKGYLSPALVETALAAVERIRTGSELQQIWDEREDGAAWRDSLHDLEDRLHED
jgi:hypothetical protein